MWFNKCGQRMKHFFSIYFLLTALCSSFAIPVEQRIVGGNVVNISKHPYLASFRVKSCEKCPYVHKCGATIYSERVLILTAQCLTNLDSKWRLMVVVGANSRSGADGIQLPISRYIIHKEYNYWTIENDIGLLFLEDSLPINNTDIKSIHIAEKRPLAGKSATVCGWGYDAEDGKPTFFLHDTIVSIVDNTDCEKIYGPGEITENMVCAGQKEGGRDGCYEDTGGPLVVDNEFVGMVSWGRGCAREGYPSVYTNLPAYKEWIANEIKELF